MPAIKMNDVLGLGLYCWKQKYLGASRPIVSFDSESVDSCSALSWVWLSLVYVNRCCRHCAVLRRCHMNLFRRRRMNH